MYILDTDVFSITSPANGFSVVIKNQSGLYFSVATIMEVRFGIEKSIAKGATKKAASLKKWLAAAETVHQHRIIPISIEIAHRAGEMLYDAVREGFMPSTEDAFIAATAAVKGYQVLSRNEGDMTALKANWLNPIKMLPPDVPPFTFG